MKRIEFTDNFNKKGFIDFNNGEFLFSHPAKLNSIYIQNPKNELYIDSKYNVIEILLNKSITIKKPFEIFFGTPIAIIIRQNDVGNHSVTFSDDYIFESGQSSVVTTTPDAIDIFSCIPIFNGKLLTTYIQDFK